MATCEYCQCPIEVLIVSPKGQMYCSAECSSKNEVSMALRNMWQSCLQNNSQQETAPLQIRLKDSVGLPLSSVPPPPPPPPPPSASSDLPRGQNGLKSKVTDSAFPSLLPGPQETHNAIGSLSLEICAQDLPDFPIGADRAAISGWWKSFLGVSRKFFLDAESRVRLLRGFLPSHLIAVPLEEGDRKFVEHLELLRDRVDRFYLSRPQKISDIKISKTPSLATLFDNFRAQFQLALPVGTSEEVVEAIARDALISELSEISFMQRSVEQWRSLSHEERTIQKLFAIFGETFRKWKPDRTVNPVSCRNLSTLPAAPSPGMMAPTPGVAIGEKRRRVQLQSRSLSRSSDYEEDEYIPDHHYQSNPNYYGRPKGHPHSSSSASATGGTTPFHISYHSNGGGRSNYPNGSSRSGSSHFNTHFKGSMRDPTKRE